MFKITAIVSLMLIATWSHADYRRTKKEIRSSPSGAFDSGSTLWAASLSCDSCGSECASACGTRHFRSCCFNYLRKKRGQNSFKVWAQNLHDMKPERSQDMPSFFAEDLPESWSFLSNDFQPYPVDDNVDNRLQLAYDN